MSLPKAVFAIVAVLALTLAPLPAFALSSFWTTYAPGSFEGELVSNGVSYPVLTTLSISNGVLVGGYTFYEDDKTAVNGTLDSFRETASNGCVFVWHDRYGSGELSIYFTADGRSFSGEWFSYNVPTRRFPWDGAKLNGPEPRAEEPANAK